MALIICSECGKQFSDKAKACPNCGCPTELIEKTTVGEPEFIVEETETMETPPISKETYYETELELLSYDELLDFAFASVLPNIRKELNAAILEAKTGSKNKDDVHYYLSCGARVIGVKVIIDAYPDVYNVGRFFDDERENETLAKAMEAKGYEFAIANIGIGASDPTRFARRIFFKNDNYYFNYQKLQFHKASDYDLKGINFSLSATEPDDEWKTIAGFDYTPPKPVPNPNADMLIQKPVVEKRKSLSEEIANSKFWKNEENAKQTIDKFFEVSYLGGSDLEALNQLIRMVAHITWNYISLEDAFYYTSNAVDFLNGRFLADSTPIKSDTALIILRNLIKENKMINEYKFPLWKTTALNFLIYLFCFEHKAYIECVDCYYSAKKPDDRPLEVIVEKLETAFLYNPMKFGYGQEVVDEIARLQSINSPENLAKYEAMKKIIENEMLQFSELHEKIVVKRTLQLLNKHDKDRLSKFSENAYDFIKYTETGFDNRLPEKHKRSMTSFVAIVQAYYRCLGMDNVIVGHELRGGYSFFERLSDTKESKSRYEQFLLKKLQ